MARLVVAAAFLIGWGALMFVSSLVVARLFGSTAQLLFMIPTFVLSAIVGFVGAQRLWGR